MTYAWDEVQKETMQMVDDYLPRLLPVMEGMIEEFRGNLQEDSYEYLNMAIDGLNWIIEVYNATKDIINAEEAVIDSAWMDEKMKAFGSAVVDKKDGEVAALLEEAVVPFLKKMQEVAKA